MKLNIVFQYVTLLDSHFNIELFKPQRKHNKSCDYFTITIFPQTILQGTQRKYLKAKIKMIQIWSEIKSGITVRMEWSEKLSIVTHLERD